MVARWCSNGVTVTTTYTAHLTAVVRDTNGGARNFNGPRAEGDNARFHLRKTFDPNALTIGRNGKLIPSDSADMKVNREGAAFDIVYPRIATDGVSYCIRTIKEI